MIAKWSDLLKSTVRVRKANPLELFWLFKQDGELILPVTGSVGYGDNLKLFCVSHAYQAPETCGVVTEIVAMQLPELVSVPTGTYVIGAMLATPDRLETPRLYLASIFGLDPISSDDPLYVCVHERDLYAIDSQRYQGDPM